MADSRRTFQDRLRDRLAALRGPRTVRAGDDSTRAAGATNQTSGRDPATGPATPDPAAAGTASSCADAANSAEELAAVARCALDAAAAAIDDPQPPIGATLRLEMTLADETALLVGLTAAEAVALRAALLLTRLRADSRLRVGTPAAVNLQRALATRLRFALEERAAAPHVASTGGMVAPTRPESRDDLSRTIATALVRAQQRAEAPPQAPDVDPLTRLPLLPFLFGSFEQDLLRAARLRLPLSLIQIDIDGFRDVNARYGRAAGDRVLRGVARAIRSTLRPGDTCVRSSGDEFIVTVPGVGTEGIASVVARLEAAILRHKFAVARGLMVQVSVSTGAAAFPTDGRTHETLLAIAEARRIDRLLGRHPRPEDAARHLAFPGRPDVPVN